MKIRILGMCSFYVHVSVYIQITIYAHIFCVEVIASEILEYGMRNQLLSMHDPVMPKTK